jgi:transposase
MADENHTKHQSPSQRRYPPEIKERAVRLVVELKREDPADHNVISRVARQLNVGAESLRTLVKQAERGTEPAPPATSEKDHELAALRRHVSELERANEILLAASSFFGAELVRSTAENGHPVRMIPDSRSGSSRTVIPGDSGQRSG